MRLRLFGSDPLKKALDDAAAGGFVACPPRAVVCRVYAADGRALELTAPPLLRLAEEDRRDWAQRVAALLFDPKAWLDLPADWVLVMTQERW